MRTRRRFLRRPSLAVLALGLVAACAAPASTSRTPLADARLETIPPQAVSATDATYDASAPVARRGRRRPVRTATTHETVSAGLGRVGSNARAYLRAEVPKLVIEVDWLGTQGPSVAALEHMRVVLSTVVSKPAGIEILVEEIVDEEAADWTVSRMTEVARNHRRTETGRGEIGMYVLYLPGRLASSSSALGVAFGASEIAIFRQQVSDGTVRGLVGSEPVERAVLVHEAGHLLGLVNMGYRSPREREDGEHPGHSTSRASCMYWAVEDLALTSILTGGPPADFDADDRADLADVSAGKLGA